MRLIHAGLRLIKRWYRRRERNRAKEGRVSIKVQCQGVLLAQDSTHLGTARKRKVWAEVLKDAATLKAAVAGNGKPITASAMISILEGLKADHKLPLVLATDNGTAYKDGSVAAWLKENQVVHLKSRTHTPTDNARAERVIGEAKLLAELGRGKALSSAEHGLFSLTKAVCRLNQRPRLSRQGKSANELTQTTPGWYTRVRRSTFYHWAMSAVSSAVKNLEGRSARAAEREAIFRTLEWFGLILRTRGGHTPAGFKPDIIS